MKQSSDTEAPKVGRPTKLTPELSATLCGLLAEGWFLEHAAAEVGISDQTVRNWMHAGEADDAEEIFAEFLAACRRSRAHGERIYLARIEEKSAPMAGGVTGARPGDWKADSWRLEKMNQSLYRSTQRTEVTGADGAPFDAHAEIVKDFSA